MNLCWQGYWTFNFCLCFSNCLCDFTCGFVYDNIVVGFQFYSYLLFVRHLFFLKKKPGVQFYPWFCLTYSITFVTCPAPTVLPPSLIANLTFSSIAIGDIRSTVIDTLSPGITISVPSGKVTSPVTSVVLK